MKKFALMVLTVGVALGSFALAAEACGYGQNTGNGNCPAWNGANGPGACPGFTQGNGQGIGQGRGWMHGGNAQPAPVNPGQPAQ